MAPPIEAAAVPPVDTGVELLEDRSTPIVVGHRARRLGRSVPGAVAATLLVVGLAFGAALAPGGASGPSADRDGAGTTTADGDEPFVLDGDGAKGQDAWGEEPETTAKPDGAGEDADATDKPDVEPTAKATEKPAATPKPTQKPAATKPPTEAIALGLAIKEYHPVVEWGSCAGLDFDAYKVVRSSNSTVSWPAGEGDALIAVVEPGGTRRAYDKDAPHGTKAWYRVFCVRHTEDGYKVVNSSVTKGIEVPEEPAPPPPPDPITLGLEVASLDGGKVVLDWTACEVDGFAAYKVLRSTSTDDPSYLPYHDGTEVVGVVGEVGTTQLEAWGPESGATAWYRVQCIGFVGDQKVLLGESPVVAVTAP